MSLGDVNTENWSSRLGVGLMADDLAVFKKFVTKSKEVKTGFNQNLLRKVMAYEVISGQR
jgi:hypothetical protein